MPVDFSKYIYRYVPTPNYMLEGVQEMHRNREALAQEELARKRDAETEAHNRQTEAYDAETATQNELIRQKAVLDVVHERYGSDPDAQRIAQETLDQLGFGRSVTLGRDQPVQQESYYSPVEAGMSTAPATPPPPPEIDAAPRQNRPTLLTSPMAPEALPDAAQPSAKFPEFKGFERKGPPPPKPVYVSPASSEALQIAGQEMQPETEQLLDEAMGSAADRELDSAPGITVLNAQGQVSREAMAEGVTTEGVQQLLSGLPPEERAKVVERLMREPLNPEGLRQLGTSSRQHARSLEREQAMKGTAPISPAGQKAPPRPTPAAEQYQGTMQAGVRAAQALVDQAAGNPAHEYASRSLLEMTPELVHQSQGDQAKLAELQQNWYKIRLEEWPLEEAKRTGGGGAGGIGFKLGERIDDQILQYIKERRAQFGTVKVNELEGWAAQIEGMASGENPLGQKAALANLARTINGPGVMTNQDLAFVKNGAGVWNGLQTKINEYLKGGELGQDFINHMRGVAQFMRKAAEGKRRAAAGMAKDMVTNSFMMRNLNPEMKALAEKGALRGLLSAEDVAEDDVKLAPSGQPAPAPSSMAEELEQFKRH